MGFNAVVNESADGRVYRRAASAESREALRRQFRFLPHLRNLLPARVPDPEAFAGDVLIYRKLPGVVMPADAPVRFDTRELARDIAQFMAALHALPVEDCLAWGVPERDRTDVLLSAFDRVLPELPAEDQAWARSWRSRFELGQFQAVVTHGDLWYENILIDADTHRLTAVIDFDTAGVGDPAWDLATQFHCGVEFAQLVFDAYGCEDPGMWWRAQQLLQLRQFEGLDWAIREGDDIELDESLEKLRCAGVLRETRTLQTKRRLAAP